VASSGARPPDADRLASELERYRQEAERLKRLAESVERVFTTRDVEQADAIRRTLETLGWGETRIREFFRMNAEHFEQDPDASGQSSETEGQTGNPSAGEAVSEGDRNRAKTPQELEVLARTLEQMRANFIRKELASALDNVLQTDKDCNKILKAIESRPTPDPAVKEKAKSVVRTKIEREALDILRSQREKAGGMFDESWIPDAVSQAAKAVVEEYRSVIGDFSFLGKTPETVSEEDRILSAPPVPAPKFTPGKRTGDYEAELEKHTVDLIQRMMLENRGAKVSKA
jgi:DNA-binding transcriptional MerR regulator